MTWRPSPGAARARAQARRAPAAPVADHTVDLSLCMAQTRAFGALLGPGAEQGTRVCIPWGRGIGKSWFQRFVWFALVARWDGKVRPGATLPGVRIVLLMPTLTQARKVHEDLLLEELEHQWAPLGGRLNRSTWRINFPGGSWVQFISGVRAHLARGLRADVLSVDEADDVEPETIDSVVKPWFSEPHSLRLMLLGGTPRRGRKGLLWRAHHEWPKLSPKYRSFHATAVDAPRLVDPVYLEEVRRDTPASIFLREWMCDFDSAEGLVFPMFLETFHVRPAPPPAEVVWDDIFFCADHGYVDPGCILTVGVIGRGSDARVHVLDEVYATEKDPTWWEEQAISRIAAYPHAKWYADPARPDINALWRKRGANIRKVEKGAGSIASGVGFVQRYLKVRSRMERTEGRAVPAEYARLYVDPRCRNLIAEFGLHRRKRDPRNPEGFVEEFEDRDNHCFPAGTLVWCRRGQVPIEAVTCEDEVMTRKGWRRVVAAGLTRRNAPLRTACLSSGAVVRATPDHRFFANGVWTRLDALRYGDTLVGCESPTGQQKPLCSAADDTVGTPTRWTARYAGTSTRRLTEAFTGRSGKRPMAQCQTVTTFTMWTGTRSTTASKTSSASRPLRTLLVTLANGPRRILNLLARTWTGLARPPRSGTQALRGGPGTRSTPRRPGSASSTPNPGRAPSAEPPLPRGSAIPRSAETHARQRQDACPAWTTLTACAPSAAKSSGGIGSRTPQHAGVHVVRVLDEGERADVFCLTVDTDHEFFANGVLVANCLDALRYGLTSHFPDVFRAHNARTLDGRQTAA